VHSSSLTLRGLSLLVDYQPIWPVLRLRGCNTVLWRFIMPGNLKKYLRIVDNVSIQFNKINKGNADVTAKIKYTDGFAETLNRGDHVIAYEGDSITINFDFKEQEELLKEHFVELETSVRVIRT
jgi:hypothetical protein